MNAVSSRPHTPSRSPAHSTPVRIPPAPHPDLPTANALRFKHLYGYTQGSSASSYLSQDTESTCSDAEYNTFVFETGSEIIIDETDGSSIPESDTSVSSTGSLSSSPPLFPISRVTSIAHSHVAETSPSEAMVEDVEAIEVWEDRAATPRMTPLDSNAALVPITDDFSLGDMDCPPVLPDLSAAGTRSRSRVRLARPVDERTATPTGRRRLRTAARTPSTPSLQPRASVASDDDFRCMTCHHAGLCADLVMKDPNFRCGDTISSGARFGSWSSSGVEVSGGESAGGKTPWTRQNLQGINFGDREHIVEEKDRNRLRVLEGGIDFVDYDEAYDQADPGGGRSLLDMEDIGRAIRETSPSMNRAAASPASSNSASLHQHEHSAHGPARQGWPQHQNTHTSSSEASYDFSSDATSSSPGLLSVCANPIIDLEPALPKSVVERKVSISPSARQREYQSSTRRSNSPDSRERSGSRTRGNPVWKLHNITAGLTAGLFAGSSPSGRSDEGRYDYDDELYGVDVVERGRGRLR